MTPAVVSSISSNGVSVFLCSLSFCLSLCSFYFFVFSLCVFSLSFSLSFFFSLSFSLFSLFSQSFLSGFFVFSFFVFLLLSFFLLSFSIYIITPLLSFCLFSVCLSLSLILLSFGSSPLSSLQSAIFIQTSELFPQRRWRPIFTGSVRAAATLLVTSAVTPHGSPYWYPSGIEKNTCKSCWTIFIHFFTNNS